jgi:glycerophosphoryl diester phosphodiesterase
MPLSLSGLLDGLLSPAPDPARIGFLKKQAFAHRGLHGGGVVENSGTAFQAAIAGGFGIELDVQASRDGEAMVFHDATLDRLTDQTGPIVDRSRATLEAIMLKGAAEPIPALDTILSLVAGRVPILIEVKAEIGAVGHLCLAVRRALEGYRASVGVMSFNPEVGRWFARHAPRLARGLVMTEGQDIDVAASLKGRVIRHAALWRAKPDFLAYDIRDLPARFPAAQRARGVPVLTWTVRTSEQEQTARTAADEIIFERPGL